MIRGRVDGRVGLDGREVDARRDVRCVAPGFDDTASLVVAVDMGMDQSTGEVIRGDGRRTDASQSCERQETHKH
jgi:hypothetical protein